MKLCFLLGTSKCLFYNKIQIATQNDDLHILLLMKKYCKPTFHYLELQDIKSCALINWLVWLLNSTKRIICNRLCTKLKFFFWSDHFFQNRANSIGLRVGDFFSDLLVGEDLANWYHVCRVYGGMVVSLESLSCNKNVDLTKAKPYNYSWSGKIIHNCFSK